MWCASYQGSAVESKNISVLSKNISLLRSLCTLALYYYYYYLLFCCYKGIGLALLRRPFFLVSFCCSKWNSQWQGRHKTRKKKILKMEECFTGKKKKKAKMPQGGQYWQTTDETEVRYAQNKQKGEQKKHKTNTKAEMTADTRGGGRWRWGGGGASRLCCCVMARPHNASTQYKARDTKFKLI